MIEITDINDSRVGNYISLKKSNSDDVIVCDSEKVVLKLLQNSSEIISIFGTEKFINENIDTISSKISDDKIFYANKAIMEKIVGHNLHHGVMAVAKKPPSYNLCDLSDKILVVNGITGPENIGNLIRSAAAFNVDSIIIDSKSVSPFVRRAIRVSMGNIFFVKVHFSSNLQESLKQLQKNKYKVYSAANSSNAISIYNCQFNEKSAFIIGSEGHGIDKNIIELSDYIVKIPVNDNVAHLNAANAGTIFLYTLTNQ